MGSGYIDSGAIDGATGLALDENFIRRQTKNLQAGLDSYVAAGRIPGISAVISVAGQRIAAHSGIADPKSLVPFSSSSRFETSCLMKFFVSLLTLLLVKEGKLGLDVPIGEYLDDLKSAAPDKAQNITIRHLATHASGYRGTDISQLAVRAGFDWAKLLLHMANTRQLFAPGSVFNYEHTEHVILGEIIRRAIGKSATDLVAARMLNPVGVDVDPAASNDPVGKVVPHTMNADGSFKPIPSAPTCKFWAASLPSATLSLDEIASVCDALVMGSLFPALPHLLDDLMEPVVRTAPTLVMPNCETMPEAFGLCGAIYGQGVIGHNFSTIGQACALRIVPAESAVILVGTNAWVPHERDHIVQWILSSFVDPAPASTDREQQLSDKHGYSATKLFGGFPVQMLQGTYWGSYMSEIKVFLENGEVLVSGNGPRGGQRICEITTETSGLAHVRSRKPIPIVFFADPNDGAPCLALGLNTYKKVRA